MTEIIGLDLGMGGTKKWTARGGDVILSQVAVPVGKTYDFKAIGLKAAKKPVVILNGAGRFIVGAGAHDHGQPVERLDFDKFNGAPELQALVWAALSDEPLDNPLRLVVGLPLGLVQGAQAKAQIERVKSWIYGGHVWKADKKQCEAAIEDVKCVSQAHAAYVDWLIDLNGDQVQDVARGAEVGVISIGFNTIELLALRDNTPVARLASSEQIGVRRLLEIVRAQRAGDYSLGDLDNELRAGGIRGTEAFGQWASLVRGHIEAKWGGVAARFAKVIAVGGGALLLADELRDVFGGRLAESDEPVLSVARGLFKLGLISQ